MAQSARDYMNRADECVRLANLTKDEMIQVVLLRQRQMYLKRQKISGSSATQFRIQRTRTQE